MAAIDRSHPERAPVVAPAGAAGGGEVGHRRPGLDRPGAVVDGPREQSRPGHRGQDEGPETDGGPGPTPGDPGPQQGAGRRRPDQGTGVEQGVEPHHPSGVTGHPGGGGGVHGHVDQAGRHHAQDEGGHEGGTVGHPGGGQEDDPHPTRVRLRKRAVPQRSARPPLAAATRPPAPMETDSRRPRRPAEKWRRCSMLVAATAQVPQKTPKATNVAAHGSQRFAHRVQLRDVDRGRGSSAGTVDAKGRMPASRAPPGDPASEGSSSCRPTSTGRPCRFWR